MNVSGDSLTYLGATALADRIRRYWAERGHPNVETSVLQVSVSEQGHHDVLYCVRSNIGPRAERKA